MFYKLHKLMDSDLVVLFDFEKGELTIFIREMCCWRVGLKKWLLFAAIYAIIFRYYLKIKDEFSIL